MLSNAALVAAHELGAEDAHEAGEHDQIGRCTSIAVANAGIEGIARREWRVIDHFAGDAMRLPRTPSPPHRAGSRSPPPPAPAKLSVAQRATMACMFEPRSEMRMTMRFMSGGPTGARV